MPRENRNLKLYNNHFYFSSIVCGDQIGSKCYGLTLISPQGQQAGHASENMIRELEDGKVKNSLHIVTLPIQILLGPNNKCLFVSTNNGTVRVYLFPGANVGVNFPTGENVIELIAHHGPCTLR